MKRLMPAIRDWFEAEAVAWIVAHGNGLKPRSESYLDLYKAAFAGLDYYTIMRAANSVETVMGISAHRLWDDKMKEASS